MKVLHVTPFFYPAWAYGGQARVSYYLSRSLAELGLQVEVVTTDALDSRKRSKDLDFEMEGLSVRAYRNLSNRLSYHFHFFCPRRLAGEKARLSAFDLVHIHGHRNLLNTRIHFWAHAAGIPVVLQPHGSLLKIERRKGMKTLYDLLWGNRQIAMTDRFVAVSTVEQRQFLALGIPPERIRVVPNGVFLEEPGTGLSFKQRFGIEGHYILFMGRLAPLKGLESLVDSLCLIPDPCLHLAICGSDMGVKSGLRRRIRRLGLSERVIFTGLLESPWREAGYKEALFTVNVSEHEAFGLVPFESILCGTPAIVSEHSGCGEWIEKSGGGHLVPYADPSAIAKVILERNPHEDRERIHRAREWILTNLSWREVAIQMTHVYDELLDPSGKGQAERHLRSLTGRSGRAPF